MPDDLSELRAQMDRMEAMLRRLLVAKADRRAPRLPKRTQPDDPEITSRVVRAMTKGKATG